jgi:cytidylate kinase
MFNIAIDGPAGAGKSTIAKEIAKKINFVYVDTGAMFRSMALYLLNNNIDPENEELVSSSCPDMDITITYVDGEQQVILNGENVSGKIRTEEVGKTASTIAKYGAVRTKLLELQRALASKEQVIMDGRDIGTAVLPNAELKIYLTASVDVRAKRRYDELIIHGENPDLETIKKDIEQRDYQDMNRDIAPLKQAEDAILIDSSDMTIAEVVDKIVDLAHQK